MSKKNYFLAEKYLQEKFSVGTAIIFNNKELKIINSGKPRPVSGECKSDLYLDCCDKKNNKYEIKISLKLDNYEFLENKTSLERAKELLGVNAEKIIQIATLTIKEKFENRALVKWNNADNNIRVILGWKLEIFKNTTRQLMTQPELTEDQKIKILNGSNSSIAKKDCKLNNKVIKNSGVPNYILIIDKDPEKLNEQSANEVINNLQKIEDYSKKIIINFGYTAINYRKGLDKWDGDRPLAVYVTWKYEEEKLIPIICYDKPLQHRANKICNLLKEEIEKLDYKNIREENYESFFNI